MSYSAVFVFDLDDTLYKEIDFLKSAYKEIAVLVDRNNSLLLYEEMLEDYYAKNNVFMNITYRYKDYSINDLLKIYRLHYPDIKLNRDVSLTLHYLKNQGKTGLISDGRSVTQRNKIKALGLDGYFDKVVISDEVGYMKPDIRLFEQFHEYQTETYFYIANDTDKDFLAPNHLGWKTVCLMDNENVNIKKQNFSLEDKFLPQHRINNFMELKNII